MRRATRSLQKRRLFATNNTETIADPADPRLQDRLEPFASQVDGTILANTALPVGSDRMQGVFWSEDLQRLTFESSRQFHLACVGEAELNRIAEMVAGQFAQESVLTFTYQPGDVSSADSFIAEVPGVDVQRFHNALATDPDARTRLGGGSITARAGSCTSASGQRSRRTAAATAPPSRQGPSACLW